MVHQGSCHCGRIKFEVEGEIGPSVMSCNCSMCQRKGILMWFVPRAALRLLTPEADAATYLFNQHKIKHRFCTNCGIHPFGEGPSPAGEAMAAVNVRCIEGIDLQALEVKHFDGRAL
ncbi:MAG TPA: GFA family protein [Burkholderiaceae bacterium]